MTTTKTKETIEGARIRKVTLASLDRSPLTGEQKAEAARVSALIVGSEIERIDGHNAGDTWMMGLVAHVAPSMVPVNAPNSARAHLAAEQIRAVIGGAL